MIREASVFINEVAEVLRVEGLARLAARDYAIVYPTGDALEDGINSTAILRMAHKLQGIAEELGLIADADDRPK